jgi:hypothetical protein
MSNIWLPSLKLIYKSWNCYSFKAPIHWMTFSLSTSAISFSMYLSCYYSPLKWSLFRELVREICESEIGCIWDLGLWVFNTLLCTPFDISPCCFTVDVGKLPNHVNPVVFCFFVFCLNTILRLFRLSVCVRNSRLFVQQIGIRALGFDLGNFFWADFCVY